MIIKTSEYICVDLNIILSKGLNNKEIDTDLLQEHIKDCSYCQEKLSIMVKEFNKNLPSFIYKIAKFSI